MLKMHSLDNRPSSCYDMFHILPGAVDEGHGEALENVFKTSGEAGSGWLVRPGSYEEEEA